MTSFKTKLLVAGLYCFVSVIGYWLAQELMGISVYRNVIAASISVFVFVPFCRRVNTSYVLACVFAVQVLLPIAFVAVSLSVFVGAPVEKVFSVLPEVAGYGVLAWGASAGVFLLVRASRKTSD